MSDVADPNEAMLSVREVGVYFAGARNPLSPSTVYRWTRKGKLPKPVQIGPQTYRWRLSDCKRVRDTMLGGAP